MLNNGLIVIMLFIGFIIGVVAMHASDYYLTEKPVMTYICDRQNMSYYDWDRDTNNNIVVICEQPANRTLISMVEK